MGNARVLLGQNCANKCKWSFYPCFISHGVLSKGDVVPGKILGVAGGLSDCKTESFRTRRKTMYGVDLRKLRGGDICGR